MPSDPWLFGSFARIPRPALVLSDGEAMTFALGDRQAVIMRPQSALEDRGTVDDQVMRRDGAADTRRVGADDVERFRCRHVFDHDLEPLVIAQQRQQALFHKDGLAVEDIDGGIGDFAVDEQRHAVLDHRL